MIRIQTADLQAVAGRADQFPRGQRPEIAFAGRSNVGKSSLINRLLGRRKLAYTSSTPGRPALSSRARQLREGAIDVSS